MTTASPPMCWTIIDRAFSDTAIRASIFSSAGRSSPAAALIARDRTCQVWKVATNGPSADQRAMSDALGVVGSWTWTTSKWPSVSQVFTRAAVRGPKVTRATEPLYGTPTARPDETTYGGTASESSTGARTDTSWPTAINASARSRTWFCTPPGVPSEYGHTTPILTKRFLLVQEDPLQHVPVLGVGGDALGERVCAALCHGGRAALWIDGVVEGDHQVRPVVVQGRRDERRTRTQAQRGRTRRHPGRPAEERHRHTTLRQIAVRDQADEPACSQSLREYADHVVVAAGQRKDLHAELLAIRDEAVEQRLRPEPFGHGRHRHPGPAGPGARVVVVRQVRQRANDTAAGFVGVAEKLLVDRAHGADDLLIVPVGHAER